MMTMMMTNNESRRMAGMTTVIVTTSDGGERRDALVALREGVLETVLAMRCGRGDVGMRDVLADAVGAACGHAAVAVRPDRLAVIRAVAECAREVTA